MKIAKSLAAAAVLAAASLGSPAYAADVSSPAQGLAIFTPGETFFGSSWLSSDVGDTFSNRYVFSVSGDPANLRALVGSTTAYAGGGLDIDSFSVYSSGGSLISNGTASSTGDLDFWTLSADALAVGNYYLQVNGNFVGSTGGAIGGTLALAPVPEPETYGMMIAGLGVLGFLARRRKAANQ